MTPVKASSFGHRIGLLPAIPRRQAVAQHLAHRLSGQPEAARRRALAPPLHIHAAPHRRIELHSIHPSCVPQNTLGMLGGPLGSMRRYVPVVLPLTMLFGALTVVTLLARVAAATYRRGLTLATGALLVGLVARPSVAVVGQPLWDDALAQTAQVARLFPDQAVVLVSPDLAGTHIPTSLAYLHDADAILVQERNPDDQVMRRGIRAWLARGRAVFIVVGLRDFSFFASDLALEAVGSAHLNLRTLERTRTRVPQAVVLTPIQLQLFRVTRTVGPDRTAIDVGTPADDLLYDLRGFHAPERDQDPARGTFRWTGPRASLTLPGGRDVTLVVAGGRPPGTPPSGRGASQKPQQTRGFVPLCPASQDF